MKRRRQKRTAEALFLAAFFGTAAVPVSAMSEVCEEEEFGDRIYFECDGFENGNWRDYFWRFWKGRLVRNMHGRTGTQAEVTLGDTRPFRVVPGEKYRLTFDFFNEGALNPEAHDPAPGKNVCFPGRIVFWDESRKPVKSVAGKDIPGGFRTTPPEAKWMTFSYEFTAPENGVMITLGFGHAVNNHWGPYLIDNVKFEKIQEEKEK